MYHKQSEAGSEMATDWYTKWGLGNNYYPMSWLPLSRISIYAGDIHVINSTFKLCHGSKASPVGTYTVG